MGAAADGARGNERGGLQLTSGLCQTLCSRYTHSYSLHAITFYIVCMLCLKVAVGAPERTGSAHVR